MLTHEQPEKQSDVPKSTVPLSGMILFKVPVFTLTKVFLLATETTHTQVVDPVPSCREPGPAAESQWDVPLPKLCSQ